MSTLFFFPGSSGSCSPYGEGRKRGRGFVWICVWFWGREPQSCRGRHRAQQCDGVRGSAVIPRGCALTGDPGGLGLGPETGGGTWELLPGLNK